MKIYILKKIASEKIRSNSVTKCKTHVLLNDSKIQKGSIPSSRRMPKTTLFLNQNAFSLMVPIRGQNYLSKDIFCKNLVYK